MAVASRESGRLGHTQSQWEPCRKPWSAPHQAVERSTLACCVRPVSRPGVVRRARFKALRGAAMKMANGENPETIRKEMMQEQEQVQLAAKGPLRGLAEAPRARAKATCYGTLVPVLFLPSAVGFRAEEPCPAPNGREEEEGAACKGWGIWKVRERGGAGKGGSQASLPRLLERTRPCRVPSKAASKGR